MAQVNKYMIDPQDAVMLLIDHQSGLFQLVRDIDLPVLRFSCDSLSQAILSGKNPHLYDSFRPRWT